MRSVIMILVLCLSCPLAAADSTAGIGYRYDGSGVFPVKNVPTAFEPAAGKGVAWRTPLPNFSLGSPIAVGDRVYAMCERDQNLDPKHLFPYLVCLDAKDGRILWETEIDHVAQVAGGKAQEIRALWRRELVSHATLFRTRCLVNIEKSMANEEGIKALEAVGWEAEVSKKKGGLYGSLPRKREKERVRKMLAQDFNLYWSDWHTSGKWGGPHIGITFPTPVSDGTDVYVATAFNSVACISPAGKVKWLCFFKSDDTSLRARYVPSPLIVAGVLVVPMDYRLRGLDPRSGRTLWEVPDRWAHGYACGGIIPLTIDGEAAVFSAGGRLVRVRDGRLLAEGLGFQGSGHPATSDGTATVFFTNASEGGAYKGQGPFHEEATYALRLEPQRDAVTVKSLWQLGDKERVDHPVFVGGRLFGGDLEVLDPATGKRTGGCSLPKNGQPNQAWVATRDRLVALGATKEGPGILTVVDISGAPKVLASGELPQAPAEGTKREQRLCEISRTTWTHHANTVPFLAEGRIYVRTMDDLWSIGR